MGTRTTSGQAMESIRLRLIYDGAGPVHWNGVGPGAFGLQDKAGMLHPGTPGAAGAVAFDFTLKVKSPGSNVLVGDFAHGTPAGRFLYLGWRNAEGHFAQRLKVPLSVSADDLRQAIAQQRPLVTTLVDHRPRATTTGANIGGTRAVAWTLPSP